MDNESVAKRLFTFATEARKRNSWVAKAASQAIVPVLECTKPAESLTRNQVLRFNGVGEASVEFIYRVITGESIEAVVNDVPRSTPSLRHSRTGSCGRHVSEDNSGSWDNTIRALED